MTMMAEQEVLREARRICRKLAQGCILKPTIRGGFAVTRSGGNPETARTRLSAALLDAFVARDLVQKTTDGSYALSAAGKAAWLRQKNGTDGFSAQHRLMTEQEIADEQGRKSQVSVNVLEAPLSYLKHRGLISASQYEAGERLRKDFTFAHITPRMGVDLTRPLMPGRRGAGGALPDSVLDAKDRFRRALKDAGPEFADILYDVCCELTGLEMIEKRHKWPRASAKVVLRLALNKLARHYGLGMARRAAGISVWAAENSETVGEKMVGGEGFEPPTPSV